MSAFEKPQIISHVQKSLNYTVFDCKWVPCSAKFVTLGNFARGTGVIQLYEIQHGDVKLLREVGVRSAWIQDLGLLWCGGATLPPPKKKENFVQPILQSTVAPRESSKV